MAAGLRHRLAYPGWAVVLMPRRNRNSHGYVPAVLADLLADQARELATELANGHAPRCAACRVNPATTGEFCALCKGSIISAAQRGALTRR
jgi:hypothetical protein